MTMRSSSASSSQVDAAQRSSLIASAPMLGDEGVVAVLLAHLAELFSSVSSSPSLQLRVARRR